MHQETLLYMWHRLPFAQKKAPAGYRRAPTVSSPPRRMDAGSPRASRRSASIASALPFGWDNESPASSTLVPRFAIERHDVTNERFLEFVEAGGYRDARWWSDEDWRWLQAEGHQHPLFWERSGERVVLARDVRADSAARVVARLRQPGGSLGVRAMARRCGCRRKPSFSARRSDRRPASASHPWGDDAPEPRHGVFDFASWDPEPAGSHPDGASAWGVEDLVGNGWEWTQHGVRAVPGIPCASPSYPEYSADFFDGQHFVMKGASPATARELLRPTFRNWFRPRYPYVYATFRCVKPA